MEYQMIVKITDPDTPKGMFSELTFKFNCFYCNNIWDPSNQCGNIFKIVKKKFQSQSIPKSTPIQQEDSTTEKYQYAKVN